MAKKPYRDELLEQLQDVEEAAEYLSACLEDSEEVFLLGLRDVVNAHGGVSELARLTGLNRESLYWLPQRLVRRRPSRSAPPDQPHREFTPLVSAPEAPRP